MEDNSNMSGPTTSETDEVGGNGEDVPDLVEAADLVFKSKFLSVNP